MNYLKYFENFESEKILKYIYGKDSNTSCIPNNLRQDISDILIELEDDGKYEINYQWCKPYIPKNLSKKNIDKISKYPYIEIKGIDSEVDSEVDDNLEQCVERLKDFIHDNGYYYQEKNVNDKYKIEFINKDLIKENNSLKKRIHHDIIDIIQELIDSGKIRYGFNDESRKGNFFMIRTSSADKPLYWDEISDYVIRIIQYLKGKNIIFKVRKHPKYREDINLNKDTEPNYIELEINIAKNGFDYSIKNTNTNEYIDIDYGLWGVVILW